MASHWKKVVATVVSLSIATGTCAGLAACGGDKNTDDASYTYNSYTGTSPEKWNPHTWENNTDSVVLQYVSMGLYDVGFNENKNGYEWLCEMASALPEDVTSSYVGQFGVASGDTKKAWKIKLNEKATWENGEKITADDYIYSMQQMLNPKMLNRRADTYIGGSTAIYGAASYFNQSNPMYNPLIVDGEPEEYVSSYTTDDDGKVTVTRNGETLSLYTSITKTVLTFFGNGTIKDYYGQGYANFFYVEYEGDVSNPDEIPDYVFEEEEEDGTKVYYADLYKKWAGQEDVRGWIALTEELIEDYKIIALNFGDKNPTAWNEFACYYAGVSPEFDWAGVGLLKTGDYEITIIYQNSVSEFNVKYSLTSTWLVYKDLYEANKITTSCSDIISSRYCTSKETTLSYGPYKLTSFSDNYFELSKNDNWYGYTDGEHVGQFQTTKITYRRITGSTAHETAMQNFMSGALDDIAILGSEMGDYGQSKYLQQTPESYTMQFFINFEYAKLQPRDTATENHSVLSLATFRKALSYSMDRAQYCSTYSPASVPGFGLLNYMYVYDPDTGLLYRDSEEGKKTILAFEGYTQNADGKWTYGDNVYDTIDDAYDTITNYDVDYAAELLHDAYLEATQADILTSKDVVIDYGYANTTVSQTAQALIQMFNDQVKAAVDKCKEKYPNESFNSVTYRYKTFSDEDLFWAALKDGSLDLAFSGWGGSAFDIWGTIFSCYIDQTNVMVKGFDKVAKETDVTVEVNGKNITASLYDWASWLNNGQTADDFDKTNLADTLGVLVGDADVSLNLKVLAACELAQLNTYCNFPVYYMYDNALQSAKVTSGSDEYIQLIGYGGIRYLTYNYNDAEWEQFVKSHGGTLENFYKTN